jgi:catechol 2,3-dioxygenase-like lactoylglutathione lyase family enzyme
VHFCFETDNIDRFIAEMKTKGVACSDKKLGSDETWQTWLKDPDGNNFEIHQYTPKSYQRVGGVAQVTW